MSSNKCIFSIPPIIRGVEKEAMSGTSADLYIAVATLFHFLYKKDPLTIFVSEYY